MFTLQQVVQPIAVLGAVEEPTGFDAWIAYFSRLLVLMRGQDSLPCRNEVRLGLAVATAMFLDQGGLPRTDPDDRLAVLTQSGSMKVFLDLDLPPTVARIQ